MNEADEEMNKRQIVLEDGRYMIFYNFTPADRLGAPRYAIAIAEVTGDDAEEEH